MQSYDINALHIAHNLECVVLHIGNKHGSPFVRVACFLVGVTRFFHKSDLEDDRSLAELCGALWVTSSFEKKLKYRTEPLQVPSTKVTRRDSVLYSKLYSTGKVTC